MNDEKDPAGGGVDQCEDANGACKKCGKPKEPTRQLSLYCRACDGRDPMTGKPAGGGVLSPEEFDNVFMEEHGRSLLQYQRSQVIKAYRCCHAALMVSQQENADLKRENERLRARVVELALPPRELQEARRTIADLTAKLETAERKIMFYEGIPEGQYAAGKSFIRGQLEPRIRVLQEQLQIAVTDLQYYGPMPPDHQCGTPNARCDTSCQEYHYFCERLERIKAALKEKL